MSPEREKEIREKHDNYRVRAADFAGDCETCDLLADRDHLIERIAALEGMNAALIEAWDNWYDGPDTMINGDLIEAIIKIKDSHTGELK